VVAALLILSARGGNLRLASGLPWYAFTGGLLGLVIVGTLGYTVPRLGLSTALTVVTVSQFAVAALIDHFGWLGAPLQPLGLLRLAGLGLMVLGVWLVTR
jgi:transporter family-2 protein